MSIFTYNPNASRLGVSNHGGASIGGGGGGRGASGGRVRVGRTIRETAMRLGALEPSTRGKPDARAVKNATAFFTTGKPLPPLKKPLPSFRSTRDNSDLWDRERSNEMYMSGLGALTATQTGKPDVTALKQATVGVTPLTSPGSVSTQTGGVSTAITSVGNAIAAGLQLFNQQRLAQTNLSRARQGLPPISYQDVPGLVPTMQIQGSVDPNTGRNIMFLGIGVAALAAVVLLRKK